MYIYIYTRNYFENLSIATSTWLEGILLTHPKNMDFTITFPQTLPTPAFLPSQSLSRAARGDAVGELLLVA